MKSPILEQIADGLNKLGRRGSTLLKDFIEIEYMDLSDEEGLSSGLEEPGLHEVAGFGSLVLELPTPPREEPRPEVVNHYCSEIKIYRYNSRLFRNRHLCVIIWAIRCLCSLAIIYCYHMLVCNNIQP